MALRMTPCTTLPDFLTFGKSARSFVTAIASCSLTSIRTRTPGSTASSRLSEDPAPHSGLALPSGIEVDDLKREHLSRPRNPLIAEVFYRRGLLSAGDAAPRRPLNYASVQAIPNLSSPRCQW
jgi:hypothetical protein